MKVLCLAFVIKGHFETMDGLRLSRLSLNCWFVVFWALLEPPCSLLRQNLETEASHEDIPKEFTQITTNTIIPTFRASPSDISHKLE